MKETEEFVHTFRLLGCNWKLIEDLCQQLEKFMCSYIWREKCFKQLANSIVIAKIVNGYTQQGQITRLLFGDNVFTSILMLLLQQIMAENVKIKD